MTPLTHLSYQILLSLADRPRHGYGIIKEIEDRAGAQAAPSTGALYLALQRMEGEGLLEESPERPDEDDDGRRRYYRLTREGWEAGAAETARLEALLATARDRKLSPEAGA